MCRYSKLRNRKFGSAPCGYLICSRIHTWYIRGPKFRAICHGVRAGCVQFEYACWLMVVYVIPGEWYNTALLLPVPFPLLITPPPFYQSNFLRASSVRISLIVRVCSITVRCALESFRQLIQRAIHTNRSKIAPHVNGGLKINALLDVALSVGSTVN